VWFGVIIVMTVELGLIHPPVGMNVFVIKTVVKDVSFSTIFYGVLMLIMLMYLVLGCLMDAMAMIILTVPIIFPVIMALGFDPIWFGVIIVMTVELGLIHPPVGMNVFVIKSVIKDVSFTTIFLGVIPFVITDLIRLAILICFPMIATFLPDRIG
jgi:TRAP-type C4-dicarboxylate transport system permease large subunit